MKEMLYEVRCLKSNEDMILALAGQFKQLSQEPEKFFLFMRQVLKLSSKCEDHIFIWFLFFCLPFSRAYTLYFEVTFSLTSLYRFSRDCRAHAPSFSGRSAWLSIEYYS